MARRFGRPNAFMFGAQAHDPLGGELVEGGQLLVMGQDIF